MLNGEADYGYRVKFWTSLKLVLIQREKNKSFRRNCFRVFWQIDSTHDQELRKYSWLFQMKFDYNINIQIMQLRGLMFDSAAPHTMYQTFGTHIKCCIDP